MTRLLKAVPATLLLVLGVTSPAYASFADWLDKLSELSGPGPFIQRVGGAVDLVCKEGQWWRDPAANRAFVSGDLERSVLTTLGARIDNPFEIAVAVKALTGTQKPDWTVELQALYDRSSSDVKQQIVRLLQQRGRTLFWELREDVLNGADRRTPEERLRERLLQLGIDPGNVDGDLRVAVTTLTRSLDIVFNPFCIGDLRRSRLSIGVYSAWMVTDSVPSDYVYDPATAALKPRINAVPLAATIRTSLPFVTDRHPVVLRSIDVGASYGAIFFSGPRMGSTLTKAYVEIPRVTFRPLAFKSCQNGRCPGQWTLWDLFETEFVVKGIPGVTATDFGAASGPSSEWHWDPWVRIGLSVKFNRDQTPATLVP